MRFTCSVASVLAASGLAAGGSPASQAAEGDSGGLKPLRAAIHVDTSVSHGRRTIWLAGIPLWTTAGEQPRPIEEIARIAREQGLDVLVIADRAHADVSYGLTPFSRLFRVTASEGSIAQYGAAAYLERLKKAEQESGVLIIPGAECVPYYRWRGGVFTGLRLSHLYEHMVLVGLNTPDAFEGIPAPANRRGYRLSWTVIFNLVFVALLGLGLRAWKRGRRRIAAGILVAFSALALIDSAPFLPDRISKYPSPELTAAERLGLYAEQRGAFCFWAHPSASPGARPHHPRQWMGVSVDVSDYGSRIVVPRYYIDGFAMFNAGVRPGTAGAEWDVALREFCAEWRREPAWAVSECDFDAESSPGGLADAQTVIWATERSKPAALDALRRGSCYATREHAYRGLAVAEYELTDGHGTARSGQSLVAYGDSLVLRLTVLVRPGLWGRKNDTFPRVQVIVDGEVKGDLALGPGEERADGWVTCRSECAVRRDTRKKVSYVRVLLCNNGEPMLALNPIFVAPPEGYRK